MGSSKKEFVFSVDDGIIHCKTWMCKKEKAVIQIIHGLGEHIEYYEEFAEAANEHNFSVCMCELRGHGRTTAGMQSDGIFENIVEDERIMTRLIRQDHPDVPLYIMGNSIGSTLLLKYLSKYSDVSGAILLALAHIPQPDKMLEIVNADIEAGGIDAPSVNAIEEIFGKAIKAFSDTSAVEWTTSDKEKIAKFESSPYTNVTYSNRFFRDYMLAEIEVNDSGFIKKINRSMPIFMLSGRDDYYGDKGEWIDKRSKDMLRADFDDVQYKSYEKMRHNILQETNRRQVFDDIIEWIELRNK